MIEINALFGSIRLDKFEKRNGQDHEFWCGSTHFDRDGNVTKVVEPTLTSTIIGMYDCPPWSRYESRWARFKRWLFT